MTGVLFVVGVVVIDIHGRFQETARSGMEKPEDHFCLAGLAFDFSAEAVHREGVAKT